MANGDKAIRVWVRQRSEQHRVDHVEDGDVGTDAERQSERNNG
jgi:hypothetical protein